MKVRLLGISACAILASQLLLGEEASAVAGQENPYVSKALDLNSNNKKEKTFMEYEKSLDSLIATLTITGQEKYEEPEYAEAVKKYKQRFMAEDDAMRHFTKGENKIKSLTKDNKPIPNDVLGLTHERYEKIYNSLKNAKSDFEKDIAEIQRKNKDLENFSEEEQEKADQKINDLENKALMLGVAFTNKKEARAHLYAKLDFIVGNDDYERENKKAANKRMLDRQIEDLEAVIDEFFNGIGLTRPENIPALSSENEKDNTIKQKLRDDAKEAKINPSLRSKRHAQAITVKNNLENEKTVTEEQKKAYQQKVAERKKRFEEKDRKEELAKQQESNEEKSMLIVEPSSTSYPSYTETYTQQTQSEIKQPSKTEVFTIGGLSKGLKGQSGESGNVVDFTQDTTSNVKSQTPQVIEYTEDTNPINTQYRVKEEIVENNIVDIDKTTYSNVSGYRYGVSESDSSQYTERDKRAIRRDHVREAEELVNKYANTHAYQDRLSAQQKVNTLDQGQQKRLNQQIMNVYNGITK